MITSATSGDAAEAQRGLNRQVYAELDRWLEATPFATQALFLNWGYRAGLTVEPDHAAWSEAEGIPAADQRRLVAELVGAESLRDKDVLDVGCGRGGTLSVLERHAGARSLAGVDLCPEHVAFCRRHLAPHTRVREADACNLPQRDGSVDAVVTLECSGAFPDLPAFIAHAARVLREDGVLLWGDVFVTMLLPDLKTVLQQHGFELELQRDVTANVLSSRGASHALDRLPATTGMLKEFLERFSVQSGSPIARSLEQGTLSYRLLRFRKTNATAAPTLEDYFAACARLAEREAVFQRLIRPTEPAAKASAAQHFHRLLPFGVDVASSGTLVFALPHAGGGASLFRSYHAASDAELEFVPLQLPGRENRLSEAPFTRMPQVVEELTAALCPLLEQGRRFALLGHSLGAKVAFELALACERAGHTPLAVFACGCPAPDFPVHLAERDLDRDAFVHTLEALGGTPPEVLQNRELMSLLWPMLRADFELAASYRAASTRLRAPLTAIAAYDDPLVPPNLVRDWRRFARGHFAYHELDGGHFFMSSGRTRVLAIIRSALSEGATTFNALSAHHE